MTSGRQVGIGIVASQYEVFVRYVRACVISEKIKKSRLEGEGAEGIDRHLLALAGLSQVLMEGVVVVMRCCMRISWTKKEANVGKFGKGAADGNNRKKTGVRVIDHFVLTRHRTCTRMWTNQVVEMRLWSF